MLRLVCELEVQGVFMGLRRDVLSHFNELEVLKESSVEENKAFLDLLVFAVLADTEVTEEELRSLDEELLKLPFVWDSDAREEVTNHSAVVREFLEENIEDEAEVSAFLRTISDMITDEDHRVVAMRMYAAVATSDGLDELEISRARELGACFGWPSTKVDEILAQIQSE